MTLPLYSGNIYTKENNTQTEREVNIMSTEWNMIILWRGTARLTNGEYDSFEKGDTIWGEGSEPEEIKRWSMEDIEEAKKALAKENCYYSRYNDYLWSIEEYALEYCRYYEDGEFDMGSDYDLAEEFE